MLTIAFVELSARRSNLLALQYHITLATGLIYVRPFRIAPAQLATTRRQNLLLVQQLQPEWALRGFNAMGLSFSVHAFQRTKRPSNDGVQRAQRTVMGLLTFETSLIWTLLRLMLHTEAVVAHLPLGYVVGALSN